MAERRIEVVYCDDIRPEIRNKVSLMGVYSADLIVEHAPVTLPKLCAWINLVTPADRPFSRLRVRMMQEDRELIDTGEIFHEAAPAPIQPGGNRSEPQEHRLLNVNLAFTLSPFQIDGETWLRVVAETDDGDLKSRKLRIMQGPIE